jgi:transcriptional regulator with XRE-family HTH domain
MLNEELKEGARLRRERVGEEVRRLRIAKGVTLTALAKAAGVSISYICEVEAGRSTLSDVRRKLVAKTLGIHVKHLDAAEKVCQACHGRGVI